MDIYGIQFKIGKNLNLPFAQILMGAYEQEIKQ
jgi:hypothetical protein